MMPSMKRFLPSPSRTGLFTTAILAAVLAGCTALAPLEDRTRFYTLTPAGDSGQLAAVVPPDSAFIGIRITSVASHLRGAPIAVRSGEHEVRYEDDHRWASRLDDAVGRALAAGVQRSAGSRITVGVAPALRSAVPDVLIEVDLLACEGRRGAEGSALLMADWRVYQAREDKPAASGRLRVEKPGWNGADFGQLAALLAAALDDLAQAVGGPAVGIANESR